MKKNYTHNEIKLRISATNQYYYTIGYMFFYGLKKIFSYEQKNTTHYIFIPFGDICVQDMG